MTVVPQPPAEQRGDVAALPPNIAGLIEITENGCWEWQGPRVGGRYGRARLDVGEGQAKNVLIHRYVWTLLRRPIPSGFYACHICDNPPCCNPDHLFIGTQTDNMRDAASKGRLRSGNETLTHCPQGHPYSGQNLKVATYGGRHRWRRCRTCDNARRARFNSAVDTTMSGDESFTEWLGVELEPHWCGWPISSATWRSHQGDCDSEVLS